jgi:16S rRNA (adenine1518-N6/adenine1519-N6)-dimethyltransferase
MVSSFNPLAMSRSEILKWTLRLLQAYGIKPRESLSQNFIVDPRLINDIYAFTATCDTVEIGCGLGTLSIVLVAKTTRLTCIELDRKLCEVSSSVIQDYRFVVVNADARVYLPGPGVEQIVSNIPYHATSDLLVKIARTNSVKRAVLTMQREVVDRLLAEPGTRAYGKLTVLIRVLFDVKEKGVYPPESFYPEPEVSHKLVVLERKRPYSEDICALEVLTKALFTQRRRLVSRVLTSMLGIKVSELGSLGARISGMRVFMLSEETLLDLARTLRERGVVACK